MDLGHYIVNDNVYFNKIEAIIDANKSGANIEWVFHDTVFNGTNFTIEPESTLPNLYLARAIQLRKKYDYLVLFFSGGADSVNILETFLKNNITIDEIVVNYPETGVLNYNFNNTDTSASNNISEFKYTILPYLEKIKKEYPDLKITFHDYFIDMLNYKSVEWMTRSKDWIHPATAAKFNLSRYSHLTEILQNNSIGAIYGIDKPLIVYNTTNGKYYYILSDVSVNGAINPIDHTNMHTELFYITPDMPEIVVKQAHVILNRCKVDNSLQSIISSFFQQILLKDTLGRYEPMIVPIIYPDISHLGFQSSKASKYFMVESDDWFYNLHKSTALYNMIMSDYNNMINTLDDKYIVRDNNTVIGFKRHYQSFCIA
jgi:hypothetical protein